MSIVAKQSPISATAELLFYLTLDSASREPVPSSIARSAPVYRRYKRATQLKMYPTINYRPTTINLAMIIVIAHLLPACSSISSSSSAA